MRTTDSASMRDTERADHELEEELLTLEQAADFLKMSTSWIERSDVPRVKMGRAVRYLKSELLAYAKAHLTHSVKRGAAA